MKVTQFLESFYRDEADRSVPFTQVFEAFRQVMPETANSALLSAALYAAQSSRFSEDVLCISRDLVSDAQGRVLRSYSPPDMGFYIYHSLTDLADYVNGNEAAANLTIISASPETDLPFFAAALEAPQRILVISRPFSEDPGWGGGYTMFGQPEEGISVLELTSTECAKHTVEPDETALRAALQLYRVSGEGNTIRFLSLPKSKTALEIEGNNNSVTVAEGVTLSNCIISVRGDNCSVFIGKRSRVFGKIQIKGNGSAIAIGAGCVFTNSETRLFAQEDGVSIEIGEGGLIGKCIIRTSDSHSIFSKKTGERINPAASVKIADSVWIAEDVAVLGGAEIPAGCVIGAKALVKGKLPVANAIYAGVPAKLIKEDIEWTKERQ